MMKLDDLRSLWMLGVIAACVIAFWAAWGAIGPSMANFFISERNPASYGAWGDTFGALNTLFTGLALIAALGAILAQGETLRRQQSDQHRQKFESGLFELFRMLRAARDDFEFSPSEERAGVRQRRSGRGLDGFKEAAMEMSYWIRKSGGADRFGSGDLARLYTRVVHRRRESYLGAYFRIVYTILTMIKNDPILTEKEKEFYGNLLRTQMTSNEVALAGYNALAPYAKDLKGLLIEFRLLKYLPDGMRRRALSPHYPARAFSGRDD